MQEMYEMFGEKCAGLSRGALPEHYNCWNKEQKSLLSSAKF
jgi:hypothetical protein